MPSLLAVVSLFLVVTTSFGANCPPNGPPSNATWRLTTSNPPGCTGTSCSFFLAVRTNENPQYLDFMMQGTSKGWIAVGYTPNRGMPDADVFACAVVSGRVVILDTYNIAQGLNNVYDASQDLCPFNSSYINGRISCVFSRAIRTNDASQDKDLSAAYYQLTGGTNSLGSTATSIVSHGGSTPMISSAKVNPSSGNASAISGTGATDSLIRAHGILMIVAWPVMAVSGIFFATWMKTVLPKGWFQVHRVLMLASLFFGCVAFLLIFAGKKDTGGLVSFGNATTVAHFAIGIVVMALHIINPIISIFRCHPNEKNRWIFNILHGSGVGLTVELLALTNTGLGLALFGYYQNLSTVATPLALYLAYIAFLLVGQLFLSSIINAVRKSKSGMTTAISSHHDSTGYTKMDVDDSSTSKRTNGDGSIRVTALVLLLGVMLPLTLAQIVLLIIL